MSGDSTRKGVASLGWGRRLGYGVGDFALNLYFTTAGLFLLFYYTDVLGLSPAAAGWVFAGALIWDALFDPVMGYLAGRTRSRFGRYRPYLLWGAVPLAASWALMFYPVTLTGATLVMFATATHILFRTMYAVVGMPFLALSAVLTRDSQERGVLASLRMIAGATCGLLSAALTLKLVATLGGGQTGFFRVALGYGALATLVLFLVFVSTKEAPIDDSEEHPSFGDMWRMLRTNHAFWIVSGMMLLTSIGGTFFQKTLPYYFKYLMGREDLIGASLAILAGTVTLSIPLWTWVMRRWSKRTMALSGLFVSLSGSAMLWLASPIPGEVLPILAVIGAGAGAGFLSFWSMMPDTVEYGEWRTGVRAEGAIFGLVTFIQKAALGFAAAGLGEVLTVIGYRANVPQTAATLSLMRVVMIGVPALFSLCAMVVIAFYPLDARLHGRLVRLVQRRRSRKIIATTTIVPPMI